MVARESGTVAGTLPTTVISQTGRLGKIVHWTAQAWKDIQTRRSSWKWMRAEFDDAATVTAANTARYTAASFNLDRWAAWITSNDSLTIYLAATGVSDEGALDFIDFARYRRMYERGTQVANRPVHYAVSPAGELCFGPKPDAIYRVRGEYRKNPQTLSVNADVPEMPLHFHPLIAWRGLLLLNEHDEGGQLPIGTAVRRERELMADLERDELPKVELPDALA